MVTQPEAQSQEVVNTTTGEIAHVEKRPFSDAELRNVDSLEGIKALLGSEVSNAADLGSGFTVIDNNEGKARLVEAPLVFLFWTFNQSKTIRNADGTLASFVSAHCVQLDKAGNVVGKFVINDGSTGIYQQLLDHSTETGSYKGLFVPNGLRRSEYDTVVDGKPVHGITFYIDTTPAK